MIVLLLLLCAAHTAASAQARAPQAIYFRDACVPGHRVTIAAVGDLLFHANLQRQALAKGQNFARFFEAVTPIFKRADIVYGNLEGPAARGVSPGGREWRGPPLKDERTYDQRFYRGGEEHKLVFNLHPSVVGDLVASGFTILSTSNNHAADRGPLGIDRTIDELEANKLPFTGTRRSKETPADRPWGTVMRVKGLNIAFVACTYGTNGQPDPHNQVLACFGRKGETLPAVLDEIRRLAALPDVDAVILTPHWGNENTHQPTVAQRRLAREAIDAGASAIFGAHPHVLQPWEHYTTKDGREGLIAYSHGNFISSQVRIEQRSGLITLLEITKPAEGKARITAAGYIPTWVNFNSVPWKIVENTGKEGPESLRITTRLLPPANRVLSSAIDQLPKACDVPVAAKPPADPKRPAEVTGSITPPPAATPVAVTDTPAPVHRAPRPAKPKTTATDGFSGRERDGLR
jgi:poly-gamma-glutamate synthesis protein (capsule biosynthesis protein)